MCDEIYNKKSIKREHVAKVRLRDGGGTGMEETISLKEIFEVIKKRFVLIVAIVCAAAIIAVVVSYFVLTPIYAGSTKFIVNQGKQDESAGYSVNDVRYNVELINTYNDIITSTAISQEVVEVLGLDTKPTKLAEQIQVSSSNDSQVVTVRVEDESPVDAANIANTTVEIFQEKLPDIMNVDNVTVLAAAELGDDPTPVKPNKKLNVAIAIVLGGMIGVGIAFLLEYLDNTIRTAEDIDKHLGLPVLGTISTIEPGDVRGQQFARANTTEERGGVYGTQE